MKNGSESDETGCQPGRRARSAGAGLGTGGGIAYGRHPACSPAPARLALAPTSLVMMLRSLEEALRTGGPRHLLVGDGYVEIFGYEEEVERVKRSLNILDGEFYAMTGMHPDTTPIETDMNTRSSRELRAVKSDITDAVVESWQYRESHEPAMALIAEFNQLFTFRFDTILAAMLTRTSNIFMPVNFSERHLAEDCYGKWFDGLEDPKRTCAMQYGAPVRKEMISKFLMPVFAEMHWEDRTEHFGMLFASCMVYNNLMGTQPGERKRSKQVGVIFGLGVAPEFDTKQEVIVRQQYSAATPLEEVEGDIYLLGLDLDALDIDDKRIGLIRHNDNIGKLVIVLPVAGGRPSDDDLALLSARAKALFGERSVEFCEYDAQVWLDKMTGSGKNGTSEGGIPAHLAKHLEPRNVRNKPHPPPSLGSTL